MKHALTLLTALLLVHVKVTQATGLEQQAEKNTITKEAGRLQTQEEPRDICKLLGGRSDREFTGRPGNLYVVVGAKPRLIWMAGALQIKSSLLDGPVVEWRPDYVQLQPAALVGVNGQPVEGVAVEKYCWIGPMDSLLTEHVFKNSGTADRKLLLSFDLQEVAELKSLDGMVMTCKIWAGNREVFGALSASHPLTVSDGKIRMEVSVPAGKSVSCVVSLAIGTDAGKVGGAVRPSADSRAESTRYWNRLLTKEIPTFDCSDPYLEKLYYFRWWSLLTKMNVGGYGRWSKPLAREGTSEFNCLINYSGAPSTVDLRWMRSPEWAYGNIQSFYENLNDGKLANHIWPNKLDGDPANYGPGLNGAPTHFPYHNFLVKALADTYALHPDKAMLLGLWPALQQATGFYDRELDVDHDGLYETYPWSNVTGQEWAARFLYFHPFDRMLKYDRTWRPKDDAEAAKTADLIEKSVVLSPGTKIPRTAEAMLKLVDQDRNYRQESVDQNCFAYADMKAMADIAEILGEKDARERWLAAAEKTRGQVLARFWDSTTGFFYDRDGASKEWALVKSPTGFYPFWAGIGGKDHLPIFKHLFNPAEFWTPFPVPSISMDYPKLAELRKCGWIYWNWHNWPMTTCHVADAVARAAKELDPSLSSGAAELLMKYTKVHFIDGDLKRPCVSELFDPITGKPNRPTLDYAHSYYIDLIMRHVVGIEADPLSDEVRIEPLDLGLQRFEARNIWVKGHELAVTWKTGEFAISVDGKLVATSPKLTPLKVRLSGSVSAPRSISAVPGVVIDHVPESPKTYVGSPSLAILPDDRFKGLRALSMADSVRLPRNPITNGAEWKNGAPVALPGAKRPKIERVLIYQPTMDWMFSHHQSLTFFKGRFYAIWSNARRDEDSPGQRVLIASSADFTNWVTPRPLVDSRQDEKGVERVLTAAGFHQYDGTLVAYFGNYGPHRETTRLQAVTTIDGEHWSPVRELGIPVNPNHGPQRTSSGRLIIAGNISFPWTDDPSGLTGWHMAGIYPASTAATIKDDPASFWDVAKKQGWKAALCEGSFYQTDNGVLQMLLRNARRQPRLWLSESRDNGVSWSEPVETDFSDTDSKFHFGRLPDGRFYCVGNPVGRGRTPLVLSLSYDGIRFDQHFIIGETHYEQRMPGKYKGGEYGYPHTMIHDGYLYVIVSRQKEAVEVLRVALTELGAPQQRR